jgi:pimeloyl-ACP methyl ester carboxylesterase
MVRPPRPRLRRSTFSGLFLASLLLGVGCVCAAGATPTFEPFVIRTYDGEAHTAELIRVPVPERRDRPSARGIQLAVVRLKTRASAPGPPIFFLAGGPGLPGIGMGRSPAYFRLFDRLRDLGDVYLIDQRGTGLSDPSLQCGSHALDPDLFVSDANAEQAVRELVGDCAQKWRSRGVDLAAYNTVESAHDLDEIRKAVGAERVRLLGASYGSELALEMIRLHGDRVDRAVLAGLRGPRTALKLPGTLDLQLRRVASLIARDSTYQRLLPDTYGLVGAILEVLERKPFTITAMTQEEGSKREYRVGPAGLRMVLQADLTDGRAVTAVPAMLHTLKEGDPRIFLARLRSIYEAMARGTSLMSLTMNCATKWEPERLTRVTTEAGSSPFGNIRNLYLNPSLCDSVDVPDLGAGYRSPVISDIPVLFVSGSMDATTPPFEAEEIAWGFPRGAHMVVHHGFHETLVIGEVQKTVADYLGGKEARGRSILMPAPTFLSVATALKRLTEEPPAPR